MALSRSTWVVVLAAVAVAVAIPTEDKRTEAQEEKPLVGMTLAYDVSGVDVSRTFLGPPPCHEGLCPFIKKIIPDSYYKDHDGHDDEHEHPAPSLCGNLCDNDLVCPVGQRCCATNCGYVCHPVVIIPPPAPPPLLG